MKELRIEDKDGDLLVRDSLVRAFFSWPLPRTFLPAVAVCFVFSAASGAQVDDGDILFTDDFVTEEQVDQTARVVGRFVVQEGQLDDSPILLTDDFVVIGDRLERGPADDFEEDPALGTVYVLKRDGPLTKENAQKLIAPEGTEMRYFGRAIATNGKKIAITAEGRTGPCSNTAGCIKQRPNAVYVYRANSKGHWELEATLIAKDSRGAIDNYAANSLAFSGDRIFVGSWVPHDNRFAPGVVYVFKQTGSSTWSQASTITAPEPKFGIGFGWSLAASKDRLLVGQSDYRGTGAAFLFEAGPNNTWHLSARATPKEQRCDFGKSVALDDDQAFVASSSQCSAYLYLYDIQGRKMTLAATVQHSDPVRGRAGQSMALRRGFLAIGAGDIVLLFRRSTDGWERAGAVSHSDGLVNSLALHGDALAVNSTKRPDVDVVPNSVYFYELPGK